MAEIAAIFKGDDPIGAYVAIPIAALVAIAQSTLAPRLRILGVSPDWVLLFTVSAVLFYGFRSCIPLLLVSGLVLDTLSGAPFGLMMLSLAIANLLAGLGELNVFRTARYLPYLAIAGATLLYEGSLLILLRLLREYTTTGQAAIWWPLLWRVVLPSVVLNTLLMPIAYYLMAKLLGVRWDRGVPMVGE